MKKNKHRNLFLIAIFCILSFALPASMTAHAQDKNRTSYYNKNYTLTGNKVNDMIAIARAQMGRRYQSAYDGQAWCAYFVSDVARLAGCSSIIPGDGYCATLKNNIIRAGGQIVYTPQAGDIVFYYCSAASCRSGCSCGGPWIHVGLMVDSKNSIEGNYDAKVSFVNGFYQHHNRSHSTGNGIVIKTYVRPAYGGSGSVPSSFKEDPKYNSVKGFRGYTCTGSNVDLIQENLSTRIGSIYPSDECTIHALYTNGWCKVTCPWNDGGTRTGYTKISNFIQSPTAAMGSYTASSYINLYSKPNLGTQIYRIYPGDTCLTIGKSGSATQVFMPMSGTNHYELGWAKLPSVSTVSLTRNTKYPVNFKCRILSNSNSAVEAYGAVGDASSYVGHVYVDDDCVISEVYTNGWCKFTCSFYGKSQTVYGKFSDFSTCNLDPYSLKAPKYAKTYYKSDGAAEVGWVDVGDEITVIASSGNKSQIIYPADVGKRCGWIDSLALIDQYTVTYDANGGTGAPAAQTQNKGTEITISSAVPTRTGYTFAGWTDAKGKVVYASGSKYSDYVSITLYAVWRKNAYTITYDANGGEKAPQTQIQTYGDAVEIAAALCDRKQHIFVSNGISDAKDQEGVTLERKFLSWNTKQDGTGTTVKAGENYTPNMDVTLYAQYGKASFSETDFPKAPDRTGYTFSGWYDTALGAGKPGNKVEIGHELDPSLSGIYAYWTANTYTVSYDANTGSGAPADQIKTFGEALRLSETIPTRAGYTFKGWGLTANSEEIAYESGSEYKENENITLYAVWDKTVANLSSVTISKLPDKTTYDFGEALNAEGMTLTLTYSDGTTQTVTSDYTITGYDSKKAGTQTLTVAYGGKTATFDVTVREQPQEDIAVVTIGDVIGAAPGEEINVDIKLTKNPGFSFMMLKLSYDTNFLELVSAENKTSGNHLFMMDDVIMWDSASDVNVGSATQEPMGTVTFRVKSDIPLQDGSAQCTIGIQQDSLDCYNEKEQEVPVRAVEGTVYVDTVNYGDVNKDGSINEDDVQSLREYLITGNGSQRFDEKAADVNGDGIIDGRDIIRLNQYLLDNTVKLGYDPSKAIGSNAENLFTNDIALSVTNLSKIQDGIVTAEITIDENPGIAALSLYMNYDTDHFELINAENGTVISGTLARDSENKNLLIWSTDTVSSSTGTLAKLTFRLKDGTDAGEYPISAVVATCYDAKEKSHYGASDASYISTLMKEVAAEKISLNKTAVTLAGGDAAELEAAVMPLDTTDQTVIWESSDATVAAVSDVGQIRALKKGVATVTARIQGLTAICTVTVTSNALVESDPAKEPQKPTQPDNPPAVRITYHINTQTSSSKIAAGKKVKMEVVGSDGSRLDNTQLTWKSDKPKVATVNAKGIVTFKKNSGGKKIVITASTKDGSGKSWRFTLHSMKGAVKSIKLQGKKSMKAGTSIKLKAIIKTTKGKANKKLSWMSSKPGLVKVSSSGRVTATKKARGKVKITARATDGSGRKKTITIKIQKAN